MLAELSTEEKCYFKLRKKKIIGLSNTVIFTSVVVLQYLPISGDYLMDFPHLKQKY